MTCAETTALESIAARGRLIYTSGRVEHGPDLRVVMGTGGPSMPAAAFPCINCHGQFGEGGNEGGLTPPPITWDVLTHPFRSSFTNRDRPPYDEASLKRAIMQGVNVAGDPLHPGMPRYHMTDSQCDTLLGYLRTLGTDTDFDRGVNNTTIRIGTVLSGPDTPDSPGSVVRRSIIRFIDDINSRGGIYGRQLELFTRWVGTENDTTLNAVKHLVEDDQIFALVACYPWADDSSLMAYLAETFTPVIAPITFPLLNNDYSDGLVFHVMPSLLDQCTILLNFAATQNTNTPMTIAVAAPDDPEHKLLLNTLKRRLKRQTLIELVVLSPNTVSHESDELITMLHDMKASYVLYLDTPSRFLVLSEFLSRHHADIRFLAPAISVLPVASRVPAAVLSRTTLSFGGPLPDSQWLRDVAARTDHQRSEIRFTGLQWMTEGSLQLFVEALQRNGRKLTRATLVEQLQNVHQWRCRMLGQLTFGPQRRVGPDIIYLGVIDPDHGRIKMHEAPINNIFTTGHMTQRQGESP